MLLGQMVLIVSTRLVLILVIQCVDSWNRMERDPRTKHIFFVPCDSYGLQFLMKDIIEINWFTSRFSSV